MKPEARQPDPTVPIYERFVPAIRERTRLQKDAEDPGNRADENFQKQWALNRAQFGYFYKLECYVRPDWGKVISRGWIEAHTAEEIVTELKRRPSAGLSFVFVKSPSLSVAKQLRSEIVAIMDPQQLLRLVRRTARCEEGTSLIDQLEACIAEPNSFDGIA